jgi:hypothetical protein
MKAVGIEGSRERESKSVWGMLHISSFLPYMLLCFLLLLNSVSKDLESCVVAKRNVSGFSIFFFFSII